jgi:hypothetical protein
MLTGVLLAAGLAATLAGAQNPRDRHNPGDDKPY